MKKYLSNSKIGKQPEEVLKVHLGEKVVKENNLADKSVSGDKLLEHSVEWGHLSEDTQRIIVSQGGGGGAPLSDELGDSMYVGITQHRITIEITNLQERLDALPAMDGNYYEI